MRLVTEKSSGAESNDQRLSSTCKQYKRAILGGEEVKKIVYMKIREAEGQTEIDVCAQ